MTNHMNEMSNDAENAWELLIPATRGRLPNGASVPRTEPGGSLSARIAILGVYPAARVAPSFVGDRRMNLPVQVERTSFELGVSASSREVDTRYLGPLGIGREDVLLLDMMPYFLVNTRRTGDRSMADNIAAHERSTGAPIGLVERPPASELVELARSMPGNLERLGGYLRRCRPNLLLTLGAESAAFARGIAYRAVDRAMFYAPATALEWLGVTMRVVHLAHPGLLMTPAGKDAGWVDDHNGWCAGAGLRAVRDAIAASDVAGPGMSSS
jgi:hypothetical protein